MRFLNIVPIAITAILLGLLQGCGDESSAPSSDLYTDASVSGHTIDLKAGEYMFNIAGCASCHSGGNS